MRRWVVLTWVVLVAGCGRINFGDVTATGDASGGDGRTPDAVPTGTAQIVQNSEAQSLSTTTVTVGFASTKPGTLLIVAASSHNPATPLSGVTDNAGDTFISANAKSVWNGVGDDVDEIWYSISGIGGASTLTVTTPAATIHDVWMIEVAGVALTAPADAAVTNNGPAGNPTSAPTVSSPAGAVIVSIADVSLDITQVNAASPFTGLSIQDGNNTAFTIATAPGMYGAVWDVPSGNNGFASSTVVFAPAPL